MSEQRKGIPAKIYPNKIPEIAKLVSYDTLKENVERTGIEVHNLHPLRDRTETVTEGMETGVWGLEFVLPGTPHHAKHPGSLTQEEALNRTPLSPHILFFVGIEDGDYTDTYRLQYSVFLKPVGIHDNPLCFYCHAQRGRCHFTCRGVRPQGQSKKEAREAWKRKREEAEFERNTMARAEPKNEKCEEFALGLCFKQTECSRIHVTGAVPNGTVLDYRAVTCAMARPGPGQRKAGWAFCYKGSTCLYSHDHWSPDRCKAARARCKMLRRCHPTLPTKHSPHPPTGKRPTP